jgi:hypothetical protein
MTDAIACIDSLPQVTAAGGASVGGGRLLSFEAQVGPHDLTDSMQQQVKHAIAQCFPETFVVSTTKGMVTEQNTDICLIWAFAYEQKGRTVVGGLSYDIIDYNDHNGVIAIMSDVTGADPSSGITTFEWNEIDWRPAD